MSKNIYIMVGNIGAGKSYWLRQNVPTAQVVSRDLIRFDMLKKGEDYFAHEKEVFKAFVKTIVKKCNTFDRVYADATHINAISRIKLINNILDEWAGKEDPVFHIIYVKTPVDKCIANNSLRRGLQHVPENAIINSDKRRTVPTFEEYDYNSIMTVEYNKEN